MLKTGVGGCLLGSGCLPGIVPTHVYECMFVVCNTVCIDHFSSSLSSGAEQYIEERDVNINDLISNLRKRGNSEKAVR